MQTLGARSLFFLHIPKTAGTSLRELLSCRFAPADILALLRSDAREERAQQLNGVARYRFVHGHVPYALVDRFPRRPFVVTLLRDPVDRAVSAFYDMQRQARTAALATDAGLGRPARARDYAAAARMSLAEFVRDAQPAASRHLGNLQVSLLASGDVNERFEYTDAYRISIARADLERAKTHLAACECVGLTERMAESIELLAYALKTGPLGEVSSANRTPGRPSLAELDDGTVAALRDLTAWDRELYTFACELFEDRRRAMMRRLLSLHAAAGHADAVGSGPARQVFTFDGPVPGDGWYAPQRSGDRWFSWTGPTCASSIELASPCGTAFALRLGVLHTMSPELVSALDLRINDVPIHPSAECGVDGHVITARVPRALIRPPGESNVIAIRLPAVVRPCDLDGANPDSRQLGIAVHRIELMAV